MTSPLPVRRVLLYRVCNRGARARSSSALARCCEAATVCARSVATSVEGDWPRPKSAAARLSDSRRVLQRHIHAMRPRIDRHRVRMRGDRGGLGSAGRLDHDVGRARLVRDEYFVGIRRVGDAVGKTAFADPSRYLERAITDDAISTQTAVADTYTR
jgi:hypothetical protein